MIQSQSGRQLAAIMFTDLQGFTSETQKDEAGALQLLQEQDELVRPLLETYHGRKVKAMGDGLLLEFPNALEAVQCSVALQRGIHERNAQEQVRPLRLRIGIHLGDVQREGVDILGDAVNIASRIEPMAESGGVCMSSEVYAQVHNKVPYAFESLGPKTLRGVFEPIELYGVRMPWTERWTAPSGPRSSRLAVLPLSNISPDPNDEYFADGLTEELISTLSGVRGLRVISRTSATHYKGSTKTVSEIGSELGVGSIIEGSVRKAGDRLRVTLQLIDVATDEHRWSQTFDRRLQDVLAVQVEIAQRVSEQLKVGISPASGATDTSPIAPESYEAYLRGRRALQNNIFHSDRRTLEEARREYEGAIAADANNARAHAGLAEVYHYLGLFHFVGQRKDLWGRARKGIERALEIDPSLAEAHSALGLLLYDSNQWTEAESEARTALILNPSYADTRGWYSQLLEEEGRLEEAVHQLRLASETDPMAVDRLGQLAFGLMLARELDEAGAVIEKMGELGGRAWHYHTFMARLQADRGDFSSAIGEALLAEEHPDEHGYRGPSAARAEICAWMGDREPARALLTAMKASAEYVAGHTSYGDIQAIATVHARLGDLDEFFRLMRDAKEHHGGNALQFLRCDPSVRFIREDPRFAEVLRWMNLA